MANTRAFAVAVLALYGCGKQATVSDNYQVPNLSNGGSLPKLQPQIAPPSSVIIEGFKRYKNAADLIETNFPSEQQELIKAIKDFDLKLKKHFSTDSMLANRSALRSDAKKVIVALESESSQQSMLDLNVASSAQPLNLLLHEWQMELSKNAPRELELERYNLSLRHSLLFFAVVLEHSNAVQQKKIS